MGMNDDIFLLAIRGVLKPKTLEDARNTHNMTAGNPEGVAAARALGDLTHNVFVTAGDTKGTAGELLILDLWNNLEGFNNFFASKQVQEGGAMIFATVENREIWSPARDFRSFILPTPANKNELFVGLLRGTVRSREDAKVAFDKMAKGTINSARMEGQVSHQTFFQLTPPGQSAAGLELLGIDVWMDAQGMERFYSNAQNMAPLRDVFVGKPATSVWKRPSGHWVEW